MSSSVVRPEKILKDLGKLWVDLGKQEENGVLRACAMTLIVVAEESDDTGVIGETIASIMHEHPSRAIVVRVRESAEACLEARVFAQCWMPFGRRQQICCEQIEIRASTRSLPDVPAVVRGIVVPDLPVVLFCSTCRLLRSPALQHLLPLATKLIVDSESAGQASDTLRFLNGLPNRTVSRADLDWSRLTPWRQTIAQIFETPRNADALYAITNVQIMYTGAADPVTVYYLGGWFWHVLGTGVKIESAPGVGPGYASIAHVRIAGPDFDASVSLVDQSSVEVLVNSVKQRIVFPPATTELALRQELAITEPDRIFEDVIGLAALLAPNAL